MYTLCSEQFLSCKSGVSNLYVHASHTVKCNKWTTQVLQLSESCKITEILCYLSIIHQTLLRILQNHSGELKRLKPCTKEQNNS